MKEDTAQDYFGYEPTAVEAKDDTPKEKLDLQLEVNRLLKETKVTEDGKFEYPEGTSDWARIAIANEKKYRDIQAPLTRTAQENKLLETENTTLKAKLAELTALTDEQSNELEQLKVTDPEAYFDKRTEYEAKAASQFDEELAEVRTKTKGELEVERREQYIADFNKGREVPITQELIDDEVPAKFVKQLTANEITFEEFVTSVASFVDTPKTYGKKEDVTNVTDLGNVAGGSEPSKEKQYDNIAESYANIVF